MQSDVNIFEWECVKSNKELIYTTTQQSVITFPVEI